MATTPTLRVLSYNIHKGFSATNAQFVLKRMKASIEEVHADLVLLQEVLGHHEGHGAKVKDWPKSSQFEFIADKLWPHYAYGRNAVYVEGHHGNAVLSKYPISSFENVDISTNRLEKRGMLHAVVEIPGHARPLHVICVHLGLFETGRQKQIGHLCERIRAMVPDDCPMIVGGDFNDWREKASAVLHKELGLREVFQCLAGSHARTFPAWLPALRLDRLYFRTLTPESARTLEGGVWSELSDHVAVYGEFKLNRS